MRIDRSHTIRRWAAIVLLNPLATLLLVAALVADALTLPDHPLRGGRSFVGSWAAALIGRPSIQSQPPVDDFIAVHENGGFRRLHPEEDSWDETTRLQAERPQDMIFLHLVYFDLPAGLWAPTARTRTIRVTGSVGSAIPPQDARALRAGFLGNNYYVNQFGQAAQAGLLTGTEFVRRTTIWRGWAHNALAVAMAVVLVYSLRWIPSGGPLLVAWRERRARRRGQCPKCGYAIDDLPDPQCPECGELLVMDAAPNRR